MEFLTEYSLFLAKAVTVVAAILIIIGGLASLRGKGKGRAAGHLEIRNLNERLKEMSAALKQAVFDKEDIKSEAKAEKVKAKAEAKEKKLAQKQKEKDSDSVTDLEKAGDSGKKRVFVLDFHGDIRASAVHSLREEVTAVLSVSRPTDEIVIRLESSGGMVHSYGLAASQLQRIRQKNIRLTACVDKVAASGGYMMACVTDKILAAPFAILGSIGVIAQIPNFHRLLKKNDIDFEMLTAGEYKRTLTMLGENTEKGRKKFVEDLEDTHELFKAFVSENRASVDIARVATGEVWFGRRAIEQSLIDEIKTSDEYLADMCESADVYEVKYVEKKPLQERIGVSFQNVLDGLLVRWWNRLSQKRFYV